MSNKEIDVVKNEGEEKVYLQPGDVVTLKQDIPNKPTMYVVRKEMGIFKDQPGGTALRGIRCRWFTGNGEVQEMVVSTKDLVKIN